MLQRIRVWDLPVRLFHWSLAACVMGLVITAQLGQMQWHFRLGYCVLVLLLFRLVWGLVGGYWSRFGRFLYSPATLWRYLRGAADPALDTGHSPLGALSVFSMLLVLLLQVATGLVSDDEIAASGPYAALVPGAWVSLATQYHREIGKPLLILLVLLHVAAILFYRWRRRRNLIRPMLDGDKLADAGLPPSRDDAQSRLFALLIFGLCSAGVAGLLQLAPGA